MKPISLLLADDQPAMHLRQRLEGVPGIRVLGEASIGERAILLARELTPDILLMGISLQDPVAIEVIRQLHSASLSTRAIVLGDAQAQAIVGMLVAGAAGYVLRDEPFNIVLAALEHVSGEGAWISPGAAEALRRPIVKVLSQRELAVLQLAAQLCTNQEIAKILSISPRTVEHRLASVYNKLGVGARREAVQRAREWGLLPPLVE